MEISLTHKDKISLTCQDKISLTHGLFGEYEISLELKEHKPSVNESSRLLNLNI